MPNRKWCFVPNCTNTTPKKIFVSVPKAPQQRKQWFDRARRDVKSVSSKSTMYCCEDHFDLENDMENYLEYKLSTVRARMKPEVVPHKFACQPGRRFISTKQRVFSVKRARQKDIAEYLQPVPVAGPSTEKSEPEGVEVIEVDQPRLCNKACQTKKDLRNKSVQVSQKQLRKTDFKPSKSMFKTGKCTGKS
ncbi:uncharacterized protein LOC132707717 [Cylas formicarius]|uniref:uncharacterized protein LOC132707717 n=1 Tax=Cylas formicarius TaxID=197179 RepID=UPI0029587734|nr:uncharacterized protein LOC132707717 [Cylas formicarius]